MGVDFFVGSGVVSGVVSLARRIHGLELCQVLRALQGVWERGQCHPVEDLDAILAQVGRLVLLVRR